MKTKFYLIFSVLFMAGCVKLQMPENMISDSVNAGRSLYIDINGGMSSSTAKENQSNDSTNGNKGIIFSSTYIGAASDSDVNLKKRCLTELESEAKAKLAVTSLAYNVTSEGINRTKDKAIATCKVTIY
jgi:hypothetical protein